MKAKGPIYHVQYRRRRQGKTNYARRLALLKSRKTRLVIRKTNKNIILQFVDAAPVGDMTRVTVVSSNLAKLYGWQAKKNAYTAYLAGLYAGKQAKHKGISDFILDLGLQTPSNGSILFAAAKGALDAGLSSTYNGEKFPKEKIENMQGEIKQKFEEVKGKIIATKHEAKHEEKHETHDAKHKTKKDD